MLVNLRRALGISVCLIVLCLVYTLVETAIGQVFFSSQANGSLVHQGTTVIGSSAIGQLWSGPRWFQGRDDSYNPLASGPTNYGPRSDQLYDQVQTQVAALKHEGITPTNDLVTGSGSGLDPDISPADAYAQVNAVAAANRMPVAKVYKLVGSMVAPRYFGFLGSPYVNVLDLNLALAKLH